MKCNVIAGLCCALVLSQASSASEFTHYFTGTVTLVDPLLASEFSIGDSISGFYTFDATAVDTFGDPDLGGYEDHYTGAVANLSSGYSVSINPLETGDATLIDNAPITGDLFEVFIGVTGLPVNGMQPDFLNIGLRDTDGLMLSSDDLLSVPPDIALAEIANGYLRFDYSAFVEFDLLTLTSVPEPATLTFGIVIALVGAVHRFRRRCGITTS